MCACAVEYIFVVAFVVYYIIRLPIDDQNEEHTCGYIHEKNHCWFLLSFSPLLFCLFSFSVQLKWFSSLGRSNYEIIELQVVNANHQFMDNYRK